jgi:hypothetical protein
MRPVLLTLLLACGTPATYTETALSTAPPPPAPLTASALVRGAPATFKVTGLPWASKVTFFGSANLTAPGACPPQIAPTCLDIAQPWVTLGEAIANKDGEATLTLTMPAAAPARVEVQALSVAFGIYGTTSSVTAEVLAPDVDTDGDGALNAAEVTAGTDPRLADTDGDGVGDPQETGTNPRLADSDGDGLDDGEEATLGTDPLRADTDGDRLPDGDEVQLWQTDPRRADSDSDGVPDPVEIAPRNLVINELQARNDSTVTDATGAFPDWVELYNPTSTAIDLTRVTLQRGSTAWTPPQGVIAPRSFLRLFTDEHTTDPLVAPFALPQAGGLLILQVDGVEVDNLLWGELGADTSMARVPDGGLWTLTATPTAGAANRASASTDPSDALFRTDSTSEVRIWLPPTSRASLDVDPYTEVPAAMEWEGVYFPTVGVHLKGRLGSFRTLAEKAAFKVDLNAYEPRRLRGLETLTLNNMVQDPSYIHETLTYALFRAVGVPAPRTGYVQVYVDDELYGLYLNVETVDDTFLERWYGDGTGSMWEGSYGTDFTPWAVGSFEYDEGPLVEDRAPLEAITDLLQRAPNAANLRRLRQLVDMDELLAEQAVEHVSYHWDGYYTANNYRVYVNPTDGLTTMIPWGTDQTWEWQLDIYGSSGALFTWCMQVPECRAHYDNHLRLVAAAVGDIDLETQLDTLAAYIGPKVPLDVRGHRDPGWFQGSVDATRRTIQNHPDEVLQRLSLNCTGRNDPPECSLCDQVPFGLMCRLPVDWHTAVQTCRNYGMELAEPRTTQLNDALSAITAPYGAHWIGLSDEAVEGRYTWVTGGTARFTSWWSGEPNNCCGGEHCIGTNFGDVGYWNDYTCSTRLPFACQRVP